MLYRVICHCCGTDVLGWFLCSCAVIITT
jgi:hypothetical protein